ncbi:hypothetical protein TNCV_1184391 [Trichonephila clavipes]|nr:hypothetical protein TNCV_1184391 [Trichonephila clavipes]
MGLLAVDLVILNRSGVTRTTPELAPPLLTATHRRVSECGSVMLTSPYKAAPGLLVTDLVTLKHGQVTKMKPPSPNFRTAPMGERLSLDIFYMHQSPLHGRSSTALDLNS